VGPILDLGDHPLCDDLLQIGNSSAVPSYRQRIQLCSTCLTAHQLVPVKKEELFKSDYHYRAGLTQDVLSGMRDFTSKVISTSKRPHPKIVLDIGCNDGSLLGFFKELLPSIETIGVDPTNAILESEGKIDFSYKGFFDKSIAIKILKEHGQPDVISFTNVFAHIEDLPSLLESIQILLGPQTILAIENHYLGAILKRNQFDTFYHEHPRTYSAKSFEYIARSLGLEIISTEFPSRYGGNIRVLMSSGKEAFLNSDKDAISDESEFITAFEKLQIVFDTWRSDSKIMINSLESQGKFYGKSLPGRAVMLISALDLDASQMPAIFEQEKSPKVGFFVPGTSIEVRSDNELLGLNPDRIVVWAWHIVDEICDYLVSLNFHGEVWVPLPKFEVYKIL
jgi:SAM-dependent methyltransferase